MNRQGRSRVWRVVVPPRPTSIRCRWGVTTPGAEPPAFVELADRRRDAVGAKAVFRGLHHDIVLAAKKIEVERPVGRDFPRDIL